jgi:hypothetical protein
MLAPRGVLLKVVKEIMIRLGFRRLFRNTDTSIIECGDPFYEEGGNYVYCVSQREMEKVALGLNLPAIAFKGLNIHYIKGSEFENADETSEVFRRMRAEIERRDRRCERGLSMHHHDLLAVIILKALVAPSLRQKLIEAGYKVKDLPRSPQAPDGASAGQQP